ncbi:hypothetical protein [Butyrivibrio sp. YAB3001]|uniref:hypothetical protein n=1 Tax=Butyrivibrio sp. YAB3001 TaxID=1520812 RepID=UPI0008F68702|nr:hypothetical protein [Butyrivibrio sp. YAB3001]SFC84099.1 hypothetical protein SAMN02910398_03281 [Butyrivibrio sp. YAB3001]
MKKKRLVLLLLLTMVTMLAGCKPSEEKLSEAEDARNKLSTVREAAEERYLDIADTSLRSELDALGVKYSEILAIDFTNMSNKKIDEVLPSITELIADYGVVQSKLDGTYKQESQKNAEEAKNILVDAYVVNKMGVDITSIMLHDVTAGTYSDNYLSDGEILQAGYTLMGVKIQIHADSDTWEFVLKDSNDISYNVLAENLKDVSENGVSLVFGMDSETGSATMSYGGYFSE